MIWIKKKMNENKFRKKIGENFSSSNSRQLWRKKEEEKMQTMTGYKPSKEQIDADDAKKFASELNVFYASFALTDVSAEQRTVVERLRENSDVYYATMCLYMEM